MIKQNVKYKILINFDERQDEGAFILISYAEEYGKILGFPKEKRIDITNELLSSRSFTSVLNKFLFYFDDHIEVYYRQKIYKRV